VSYAELPSHLAEADLALAMFRPLDVTRYAFPLKVVEYMAAGLPVVTTSDTEAADLVMAAEAGKAVPFEPVAVAEACVRLLWGSQERARLSMNAQARSSAYDWTALMGAYAGLLTIEP